MLIERDSVLAPPPLTSETVEVSELGGEVEVRQMPLGERLRIQSLAWQRDGRLDVAELLASTVYASDGLPLWTKEQWDAWDEHAAAMRLFSVSARLNGFIKEDVEKKPQTPSDNS